MKSRIPYPFIIVGFPRNSFRMQKSKSTFLWRTPGASWNSARSIEKEFGFLEKPPNLAFSSLHKAPLMVPSPLCKSEQMPTPQPETEIESTSKKESVFCSNRSHTCCNFTTPLILTHTQNELSTLFHLLTLFSAARSRSSPQLQGGRKVHSSS